MSGSAATAAPTLVSGSSSAAATDEDDWETNELPVVTRATGNANSKSANVAEDVEEDDGSVGGLAAFRELRLAPPSLAQNGGEFDDAFDRRSPATGKQPQPQQPHHALFDPNNAYPDSVSPATATAAVARFGPLDPVLLAGLENPRERLSLLKLEDQIVRFIKNPREPQLTFPPLSSYHRLIIHRLAERCCLEHQTGDYNAYAQGYDGNSSRVVTLFKTAQTIVPRVLLIDLSAEKQQPAVTPASAPKIMIRKRSAGRGPHHGGPGGRGADGQNQQRSIEDRERAYAEARARIFGEESSTPTMSSTNSSTTASINSSSNSTGSGSGNSGTASRVGGAYLAAGPDGGKGFGRGRGGSGSSTGGRSQETAGPNRLANDRGNVARVTQGDGRSAGNSAPTESGFKAQQNWKESKVLWRNREQELNDPDFTRNHDAYRPSRDPPGGGGYYGGGGGRYNGGGHHALHQQQPPPPQQQFYYDGQRSYGYQGIAQPSAHGGRGRGPPSDYHRIDSQRQQPSPPEYYRHGGGPMNPPPPPPPGAFHSSYSPHARGGYGAPPPPPPPAASQLHPRRVAASGGGAYHNEFPPLGN